MRGAVQGLPAPRAQHSGGLAQGTLCWGQSLVAVSAGQPIAGPWPERELLLCSSSQLALHPRSCWLTPQASTAFHRTLA